MADITITAANVKQGANANVTDGIAGATITAGQAVHKSATTGKYILSDNDGANLKQVDGIALHAASDGQPLKVQTGGDITIGATITAGTAYYLSGTPGGICPVADVTTGDDVILIGLAKSTTVLTLRITDTGVTL
ncbi:hypothetical protein MRS76_19245 [Rhizobiaceae bacterium n13]|uniref:hypothetical protein n=1 Tax=Ferirhizobium litorale TaxID=2927786 RepID=UPI0024B301B4|nr:hypothetical protein [Fererhizobium litorale]MDI7864088.1 hypothetical protein [Fererhizobium litorale]